ncbi:MAG: hypothetical protein PHE73_01855 [Sulfurovaceae bacterium]|nr:hypothetical protein [Sulfurovaceae bacterium]
MAVGLLTVLTSVPWSEVINNAPKVAEGAKKLWNVVAKKTHLKEISYSKPHTMSESQTISSLEAAVSDLQSQILASSELIKGLADQNTQLINRIETNRVHILWLSAATAVIAVFALMLGLIIILS